jgi:hypothetical protein
VIDQDEFPSNGIPCTARFYEASAVSAQ